MSVEVTVILWQQYGRFGWLGKSASTASLKVRKTSLVAPSMFSLEVEIRIKFMESLFFRYRYLSKLKFIKTIGVAVIMGLIWFQLGRGDVTESKVNDIVGALFFLLLFNSFNSLFDVLVICKCNGL